MREEDESNIRGGWTDMDLYQAKPSPPAGAISGKEDVMKTMICPLCVNEMKAHCITLHDGPIKGYQELHSCGSCKAAVTVTVQQHDELYDAINPKGEA